MNNTKNTVKIYGYNNRDVVLGCGPWFALEDKNSLIDPYKTDALGSKTYDLPQGYEVAQSQSGELHIYDDKGNHCEVVAHSSGRPQLVSTDQNMPVLKISEQ